MADDGVGTVIIQEIYMNLSPLSFGAVVVVIAGTLLTGCALADATNPGTAKAGEAPIAGLPGPYEMGPGLMGHGPTMGMGPGGFQGMGPGAMTAFGPAVSPETLKSELAIKPNQEGAWETYAKVLQDTVLSIQATHQGTDFAAIRSMSLEDRQTLMKQMRAQRQEQIRSLSAAGTTLVAGLDDAQKIRAQQILPGLAAPGPGMMHHAGMGAM